MPISGASDEIGRRVEEPFEGHADRYRPLGGYGALVAAFNLSMAVAGAYLAGYAVAPGPTRGVAALFTIHGASDVLRFGYSRLQKSSS